MWSNDKHAERILIEDLTVNDALILVAVCAVKEEAGTDNNHIDDKKRIVALAQDHPMFLDLLDSIEPGVNKFMNMVKATDTVKYVMAAAKVLKPEHKETAFTWAAMNLMSNGILTETRKNILDKYTLLLNIDYDDAQKILVKISDQQ
jgi:hypothetical protein